MSFAIASKIKGKNMMHWIKLFQNLFMHPMIRFRYPVSLPEDIAEALGVSLSNSLPFKDFIFQLCKSAYSPTRLSRLMPREEAENVFLKAVRKERYSGKTVISYYFSEGWMEIILLFDRDSRLRRVYLHHREIPSEQGIELRLITQ